MNGKRTCDPVSRERNYMLTEKEFNLLMLLLQKDRQYSQRQLAEQMNCSLGTVNKLLKTLAEKEYCSDGKVTQQGMEALEPYRVKRAIFIAAGFGSRLVPITLNTPKPLIRVNGVRVIDTLLDAVVAAGIQEIVIVRGYLAEQFDQLLLKYPNLKFVENPLFNECNNIASAMCVRDLFSNAYVLDGDLVLKNPSLIRPYEYRTNLLGIAAERTDDWCVTPDKNGCVESVSVGGIHVFREAGISYWDREDGMKLAEDLQQVYESPGGRERFWEQVPLVFCKDHYQVAIRECRQTDILEIDTFSELKQIDRSYAL